MASLAWMDRARCLAYAEDFEMLDRLFFAERSPKAGGKKAVPFGAAGVARRICAACPVRRDCLEYSLDLEGASHWAVHWDAESGRWPTSACDGPTASRATASGGPLSAVGGPSGATYRVTPSWARTAGGMAPLTWWIAISGSGMSLRGSSRGR